MFGYVLFFIAWCCAFFDVFVFLFVFVFVHSAQCDGRRMDRSDGRSVRRAPSPSLTLDTHRLPSAFTDHHHHHHHHHCRRQRHLWQTGNFWFWRCSAAAGRRTMFSTWRESGQTREGLTCSEVVQKRLYSKVMYKHIVGFGQEGLYFLQDVTFLLLWSTISNVRVIF